jgi:peptidoglycan/xylan/chitin deacetylase (PgdA/CDA1 family)
MTPKIHIEFSIDDAHVQDVRVAQMLTYYGMSGMFYVPWANRGFMGEGALSNALVAILAKHHDIGFHSYSHPRDMKELTDDAVIFEVSRGRRELEEIIGRPITSFCYPRGKYDERVTAAVKAAGFTEARTVDVGCFRQGFDPFRKPTTVHINPRRVEYRGQSFLEYARTQLALAVNEQNGYFHLWGHGWEIERYNLWEDLDVLLSEIEQKFIRL